ncbi:MAG: aconitase family protein [Rhodocyclaceae bacterium]
MPALPQTLSTFTTVSGRQGRYHALPALAGLGPVNRLPVSLRIVLESLLRHCDGQRITAAHVQQLLNWQPNAERTEEIPFVVARVVLQDFTGVPLLVDLAAMRNVADAMGKQPTLIEPMVPVDLVVDHSVQVDYYGTPTALRQNMDKEFERNGGRYQFMKWGHAGLRHFQGGSAGHRHRASGQSGASVPRRASGGDDLYYPDTLVGTDSHTP